MSHSLKTTVGSLAIKASLPLMLLLAGCATTTITSSANPSHDRARAWRDYKDLPVTVLGSAPGWSQEQLVTVLSTSPGASNGEGRHIVMYVNPSQLPARDALCSQTETFRPGTQDGQSANVTGAMCDGTMVVTMATGRVLTAVNSPRWIKKDFDTIRDQLYQSLYPGANNPSKFEY